MSLTAIFSPMTKYTNQVSMPNKLAINPQTLSIIINTQKRFIGFQIFKQCPQTKSMNGKFYSNNVTGINGNIPKQSSSIASYNTKAVPISSHVVPLAIQ